MKVNYYKDKHYIQIHFEDEWEELQFRMMCKTWQVQDDKLEEFLKLFDDTVNKEMVEIPLPAAHNYRKKKANIIRWFIKKLFGFDISKKADIAEFATGVHGMVAIGKLIEYAFAQGQNRRIELAKPTDNKLIN